MIAVFTEVDRRVDAPDLIGFGCSIKPSERTAYSYKNHIPLISAWLTSLELNNITLVAQDWGGLIGFRMLAEIPNSFSTVSILNTGLPTGDYSMPDAFMEWLEFNQSVVEFDAGFICNNYGQGNLQDLGKDTNRSPFSTGALTLE